MEIKIQETKEYKRFKLHPKNRRVNYNKIQKLAKAMRENNLLPIYPIVVNPDFVILDGQHRFEAAKIAKLPINYVISKDGYNIDKVAESNSFQSHWKPIDYVNYYAKSGKKDYKELLQMSKDFDVQVSLIAYMHDHGKIKEKIQRGTFEFIEKDSILEILNHCRDIGTEHGFTYWKSRSFIRAIKYILSVEGYNKMRMHQKIQANRSKLVKCHEAKEYIELLQMVYNTNCNSELRFV